METPRANLRARRQSLGSGILLGIGLMAAVDEIVFHQILGWHHFYDRATPAIGLLSDGILHAAELLALVTGFFLLLSVRRGGALSPAHTRAGCFLGSGGFQLVDGTLNHKILRLHQIRYGVDPLPYDLAWNAAAVLLLLAGWVLKRLADRANSRTDDMAGRKDAA